MPSSPNIKRIDSKTLLPPMEELSHTGGSASPELNQSVCIQLASTDRRGFDLQVEGRGGLEGQRGGGHLGGQQQVQGPVVGDRG